MPINGEWGQKEWAITVGIVIFFSISVLSANPKKDFPSKYTPFHDRISIVKYLEGFKDKDMTRKECTDLLLKVSLSLDPPFNTGLGRSLSFEYVSESGELYRKRAFCKESGELLLQGWKLK